MVQLGEDGRHVGLPSKEFEPLADGVGFTPRRIDRSATGKARELLAADGAVTLTGWPAEPASIVRAAAHVGPRTTDVLRCRSTDAS